MSRGRRIRVALGVLLAIVVAGTIGFVSLEGVTTLDALYLTVTTISTVGYGDVVPRTPSGRVFTMALILTGVGTTLYLLALVAELLIEGQLRDALGRRAMATKLEHLSNHVIVCGFGRFGRVVAEALVQDRAAVAVVEEDAAKETSLAALDVPYVIGSALADEVLERAGIRHARALVAATGSDPDNVFITLSAREKRSDIRIHARAESDAGLRRLRLAGANQVVSAYHMGGLRMAHAILRPAVVDFLDVATPGRGEGISLEEIRVAEDSPLAGRTIQAIEHDQDKLRIVALKRGDAAMRLMPEATTSVAPADYLVVIGVREGLDRLAELAQAPR